MLLIVGQQRSVTSWSLQPGQQQQQTGCQSKAASPRSVLTKCPHKVSSHSVLTQCPHTVSSQHPAVPPSQPAGTVRHSSVLLISLQLLNDRHTTWLLLAAPHIERVSCVCVCVCVSCVLVNLAPANKQPGNGACLPSPMPRQLYFTVTVSCCCFPPPPPPPPPLPPPSSSLGFNGCVAVAQLHWRHLLDTHSVAAD